jgi:hypothetical protein
MCLVLLDGRDDALQRPAPAGEESARILRPARGEDFPQFGLDRRTADARKRPIARRNNGRDRGKFRQLRLGFGEPAPTLPSGRQIRLLVGGPQIGSGRPHAQICVLAPAVDLPWLRVGARNSTIWGGTFWGRTFWGGTFWRGTIRSNVIWRAYQRSDVFASIGRRAERIRSHPGGIGRPRSRNRLAATGRHFFTCLASVPIRILGSSQGFRLNWSLGDLISLVGRRLARRIRPIRG